MINFLVTFTFLLINSRVSLHFKIKEAKPRKSNLSANKLKGVFCKIKQKKASRAI